MCRRSVRGISSPNIIACVTAHAAFDKASQYFGIQLRHARACPATQCIDVAHVAGARSCLMRKVGRFLAPLTRVRANELTRAVHVAELIDSKIENTK